MTPISLFGSQYMHHAPLSEAHASRSIASSQPYPGVSPAKRARYWSAADRPYKGAVLRHNAVLSDLATADSPKPWRRRSALGTDAGQGHLSGVFSFCDAGGAWLPLGILPHSVRCPAMAGPAAEQPHLVLAPAARQTGRPRSASPARGRMCCVQQPQLRRSRPRLWSRSPSRSVHSRSQLCRNRLDQASAGSRHVTSSPPATARPRSKVTSLPPWRRASPRR